ncbi:hypothetical protein ACFOLC_02215 [Lysobacter cavernae]|uniref:Alpha/beta hydrolase n=1 Tax=Lysobacter cavernae TaxID=1685901 RepID=A0ABV7RNN2_9GAMM
MLHAVDGARGDALLMCPPLLQDGIRSQRALWSLAQAQAVAGTTVLRFDWFGSGDSAGDSRELSWAGLQDDLGAAVSALRDLSGVARPHQLALRSAALPVLARAASNNEPVDLVLWDPHLLGSAVVDDWRQQHRQQLHEAGRYPFGSDGNAADELIGFDLDPAWLDTLARQDANQWPLPAGSRVLLAVWEMTPALQQYAARQREAGVAVDVLTFDVADAPLFDDPNLFESLALPRRSVAQLARNLSGGAP